MPFEPRLVANDDDGRTRPAGSLRSKVVEVRFEADEFESPDLEVLATQLSDDAAYLARLYPPRAIPAHLLDGRRRWSTGRWRVAAAVLLLAGVSGALGLWAASERAASLKVAAVTDSADEAVADPVAVNEQNPDVPASGSASLKTESLKTAPFTAGPSVAGASENHVPTESEITGLEPGELLQELSVSEQEAVFDLLEAEPIQLARISL